MAKIMNGDFYHDECWREVAPRGVHPITYRPSRHAVEELCAHCGEVIQADDS